MMHKKFIVIGVTLSLIIVGVWFFRQQTTISEIKQEIVGATKQVAEEIIAEVNPLSIEALRKTETPGSELTIEKILSPGSNYKRYIASYKSEGLKIYGLLSIPNTKKPVGGFPAIIFNHGYIPPTQYRTTEKYVSYFDYLARNGYVIFKPDYRGHGSSEGDPSGAYGFNGYTIDVLNAFTTIQKHSDVNPQKIGMWGHSKGGYITLRCMVVHKDIKVGVIWGGVVASHADMLTHWNRKNSPPPNLPQNARRWRTALIETFGSPETNKTFWDSLSANSFLKDLSGPIQLHHADTDKTVPVSFSQELYEDLQAEQRPSELYIYAGDDHNISKNFSLAMKRSLAYFDKMLKN